MNDKGIALIKKYESLHDGDLSKVGLQPKICPAGIFTVGWGRTLRDKNGVYLRLKDKELAFSMYPNLTEEDADKMLKEDLEIFSKGVAKLVKVKLNKNQFSALVSFAYNVGLGNLEKSTLLKRVNAFPGDIQIMGEFKKWDKANGKTLRGLTLRRNEEAVLYFTK